MTKAPKASYEESQTRPRRAHPTSMSVTRIPAGCVMVIIGEAVGAGGVGLGWRLLIPSMGPLDTRRVVW